MLLRIATEFEIDNPRNYPRRAVEELRELLVQGVPAHPDPERRNFYDVELDDRVFFVYVSPSGSVTLLATWQTRLASLSAASLDVELAAFPFGVDLTTSQDPERAESRFLSRKKEEIPN